MTVPEVRDLSTSTVVPTPCFILAGGTGKNTCEQRRPWLWGVSSQRLPKVTKYPTRAW